MGISEQPLTKMNPTNLMVSILFILILSWWSAYRYRQTYDFKKSVLFLVPLEIIFLVAFFFLLKIDILICLGLGIFGVIMLMIISNYYFKQ